MKRRILSIILSFTMMLVMGCGSAKEASNHSDGSGETSINSGLPEAVAPERTKVEAFDIVTTTESKESSDSDTMISSGESYGSSTSDDVDVALDFTESEMPASVEPGTEISVSPEVTNQIRAGLLTAGEWNDNNNWVFFTNLIMNGQLITPTYGMNPKNRIIVTIISKDQTPVTNAKVELLSNSEEVIWESVSNYQGVAYVFFNLLNSNQVPGSIRVSKNGNSTSTELVLASNIDEPNSNNQSNNQNDNQTDLPVNEQANNQSNDPIYEDVTLVLDDSFSTKSLDLMFVFDTTGSMEDELSYLKTEFKDIAKKVADQNTRYCVNFYRDEGDEYVVKSNAFTYDTETIQEQLNMEVATGGGDNPEAVDQALYDGIFNHEWNTDSVKLLFLILDAPPHSGDTQINDSLQKSMIEASRQGIRIIPVASSGVDKDTETFLRTTAILTGGTYTFLTDDSGIGNSHLKPTIGDYQVENLNDCIVRIINTYYQ